MRHRDRFGFGVVSIAMAAVAQGPPSRAQDSSSEEWTMPCLIAFVLATTIANAGPSYDQTIIHSHEWVCRDIVSVPDDHDRDPIKEIVVSVTYDDSGSASVIKNLEVAHISKSGKEYHRSKQYSFFNASVDGPSWRGYQPRFNRSMWGEIVNVSGVSHYREVAHAGHSGDHPGKVLSRTDSICNLRS
jgi:hypothetical protein